MIMSASVYKYRGSLGSIIYSIILWNSNMKKLCINGIVTLTVKRNKNILDILKITPFII